MTHPPSHQKLGFIGWREWISLPDLGISAIKIKVDTGARTSAIHAENIRRLKSKDGRKRISFEVCPYQRRSDFRVACKADLLGETVVTNSGGQKEKRWLIETRAIVGEFEWPIQITLASRDQMSFRMLLGRKAVAGFFFVNPGASYLLSHDLKRKVRRGTVGAGRTAHKRKGA